MIANLDTDHRVPQCPCPLCGAELDAATGGPEPPEPGDITICIICASPLIFTEDLILRELTMVEFGALEPDHKTLVRRFMAVVRAIDRREK